MVSNSDIKMDFTIKVNVIILKEKDTATKVKVNAKVTSFKAKTKDINFAIKAKVNAKEPSVVPTL